MLGLAKRVVSPIRFTFEFEEWFLRGPFETESSFSPCFHFGNLWKSVNASSA